MTSVKFQMLHISGEWRDFSAEIEVEGDPKEIIAKYYVDSLDSGWFNVGLNVFKTLDWSCLTFDGE